MIIRWSLDEEFSSVEADDRLATVAAELLRAHRRGNHLLVVDRKLATRLAALDFSRQDRALLGRLASEFTQTGGLLNQSTCFLMIRNTFDEFVNVNGSRYEVSLGTIDKTRLLDPAALLVENVATDGWILQRILEAVSRRRKLGHIAVDALHGGGDDIANVLEATIAQKRVIVAIVDSDKNTPISQDSGKIARLRKVYTNRDWPIGLATSPPCRELENLVPIDVLIQLPSGLGCAATTPLLAISQTEDRETTPAHDRFYNYVDLKLGWSSKIVEKLDHNERNWLENKLAKAGKLEAEYALTGYGEKIIQQIKAEGRHIGALLSGLKYRAWIEAFASFFENIIWFFVAAPRLRT